MTSENHIPLREHFEALLRENEKLLDERWHAQQRALDKSTAQLEARLALLNDLRLDVLSRTEFEDKHEQLTIAIGAVRESMERMGAIYFSIPEGRHLDERLDRLENWKANVMGRAIAIALIGSIIVAAIAGIFTHLAVK